ncbi:MAG: hypothetical protein AVDCRST_MAG90-1106, partial [uncultured Microvirga sp.]
ASPRRPGPVLFARTAPVRPGSSPLSFAGLDRRPRLAGDRPGGQAAARARAPARPGAGRGDVRGRGPRPRRRHAAGARTVRGGRGRGDLAFARDLLGPAPDDRTPGRHARNALSAGRAAAAWRDPHPPPARASERPPPPLPGAPQDRPPPAAPERFSRARDVWRRQRL